MRVTVGEVRCKRLKSDVRKKIKKEGSGSEAGHWMGRETFGVTRRKLFTFA